MRQLLRNLLRQLLRQLLCQLLRQLLCQLLRHHLKKSGTLVLSESVADNEAVTEANTEAAAQVIALG